MQQIVNFILRNKVFLLYVILFFIAFGLTIQSHSYHKSKFINSANALSGGVYNTSNSVSDYFNLKSQNDLLQEENNYLRSILYNNTTNLKTDSTVVIPNGKYTLTPARVLKNSYTLQHNTLLINKGDRDSITSDLGVITSKGILGVIDNTSSKFATVISMLSTSSSISAQLKNSNHYGSLKWDGKSSGMVQLVDLPIKANVKVGDTIITSGFSQIFPKGIPIGTIKNFTPDAAENFYTLNIRLFNDMTNIEHVYIIKNNDKAEINTLINANE